MGEAKRKKLAGIKPVDMDVVRRAAEAVIKVMRATSDNRGYDCAVHASLLTQLLNEQGIPAVRKAGYAAWRINSGGADVIAHHPDSLEKTGGGFCGHAWVEVGKTIVDPTAWQWAHKMAELESLNPKGSTVHPSVASLSVLIIAKVDTKSFDAVANAYSFEAYYEARPELEKDAFTPMAEDILIQYARMVFRNPAVNVTGIADAVYSEAA